MKTSSSLAAALACLTAVIGTNAEAAKVKFDLDHGVRMQSEDGRLKLDVDARVHYDTARFNSDVTVLPDDEVLRRARLGVGLSFADRLSARMDYEFATVGRGWKNLWLQYDFNKHWSVRAGNQAVPFGLDEGASSDSLMFTERSLQNALAPGLLQGVSTRVEGSHWGASVGFYGNDISDEDTRKVDGRSVVGRIAFAPIDKERMTLHLGASFEHRDAKSGAVLRYRSRPEVGITSVRLVDTGTLTGISNLQTAEADLAWAPGPFTLQLQAMQSTVARDLESDLTFQGLSAAASFVFTGERRSYRVATGSFGSLKPRHKWGAIELALRFSRLDLEDQLVTGGREDNATVALNWYWTRGSRLALDYIKIHARPNRNGVDESPDALILRVQAGF